MRLLFNLLGDFYLFTTSSLFVFIPIAALIFPLRSFSYRFMHLWNRMLLHSFGIELDISGIENVEKMKGVLFVANHSSYLDIPVLFASLPCQFGFVAKISLLWLLPVSLWVYATGGLFFERRRTKREFSRMMTLIRLIKAGRNFLLFPEGTRTRTGKPGRFSPATFKIATLSGATVYPVCIDGSFALLPPGSFFVRQGVINVTIGEEICAADSAMLLEKTSRWFASFQKDKLPR